MNLLLFHNIRSMHKFLIEIIFSSFVSTSFVSYKSMMEDSEPDRKNIEFYVHGPQVKRQANKLSTVVLFNSQY